MVATAKDGVKLTTVDGNVSVLSSHFVAATKEVTDAKVMAKFWTIPF